MGRSISLKVDYFSHDSERSSILTFMERRYGNDGYAFHYKLMELLCKEDKHFVNIKDLNDIDAMHISIIADNFFPDFSKSEEYPTVEDKFFAFCEVFAKAKIIDTDLWTNHQILWCDDLMQRIKHVYDKRKSECVTIEDIRRINGISAS